MSYETKEEARELHRLTTENAAMYQALVDIRNIDFRYGATDAAAYRMYRIAREALEKLNK